jgi:hypothetical protein
MKALAFTIALVVFQITAKAHFNTDSQKTIDSQFNFEIENTDFEPWKINTPSPVLDFEIIAFPNPTNQFFQIHIDGFGPIELRYEVLNLFGQIVTQGEIVSQRTWVDLSTQEYSTYILNIFDSENRFIRSIQIVKEH